MKKKNIIFLSIFVFVMCIGGSFAWYVWQGANIDVNVTFSSIDKYINYETSIDMNGNEDGLTPSEDHSSGVIENVDFTKKDIAKSLNLYGSMYLKIEECDSSTSTSCDNYDNLFRTSSLRWTLVSINNNVESEISTGNFVGEQVGNEIPMYINFELDENITYKVYIWIDENSNANIDISGLSLNTSIISESKPNDGTDASKNDELYIREIQYGAGTINNLGLYSSMYEITGYKIINSETMPSASDTDWNGVTSNEATTEPGYLANISLGYTMQSTNNICVKNSNNGVYCKNIGKYNDVVAAPTVDLCVANLTYNGSSQQLTSVTGGTGYTLSNIVQTNAGTHTVTATLGTNYEWNDGTTGNKTFDCSISPKSLTDSMVTINPTSYEYDGTAKTPTVTVVDGSTTLVKNTDYTVTYSNNTNAGTATTAVTGKGNYSGTINKEFVILEAIYEVFDENNDHVSYELSLANAINDSSNGYTIKPLKNNTSSGVTNNKNLTLDPDGYTITMTGAITNTGTLTITGTGTITSSTSRVLTNSSGTLNINGGNINTSSGTLSAVYGTGGTINVTGGTITGNGNIAAVLNEGSTLSVTNGVISGYHGINTKSGNVSLSGGTITGTVYQAVYNSGTGSSINITGGTYAGTSASTIYAISGTTTISGGTFGTNNSDCTATEGVCYAFNTDGGVINIDGGTISGVKWVASISSGTMNYGNSATPSITGITNGIDVEGGTLNFKQGTLSTTDSNITVYVNGTGGTINVSGGTVTSTSATAILLNKTSVLNVSGGNIDGGTYGIYDNETSSTISITGGSVTSGDVAVYAESGTVNISGASTSITGGKISAVHNNGASMNISNGIFTSAGDDSKIKVLLNDAGTINITGGSFTTDDTYCSDAACWGIFTTGGTVNLDGGSFATKWIAEVYSGTLNYGKNATPNINNSGGGIITDSSGTLNFIKGSLTLVNSGIYATGGDINFEGGTLSTPSVSSIYVLPDVTAQIDITGGTITGSYGIFSNSGVINVSGDTTSISGTTKAIHTNSGTLNISGGSLTGGTSPSVTNNGAVVNISGGTFTRNEGTNILYNASGTMTISGGVINPNEDYCADNTCYGIGVDSGVVNIDGGTYNTKYVGRVYKNSVGTGTLNYGVNNSPSISGVSNGIYISSGTLNFNKGSLTTTNSNIVMAGGTANVSGGTVTSSSSAVYSSAGTMNISGGNVTGLRAIYNIENSTAALNISGGTLSGTTSDAINHYGTGTLAITGGSIYAGDCSSCTAVWNHGGGTLTLGTNDSSVSTSSPKLYSVQYRAIASRSNTFNFYDGDLYGATLTPYSGTATSTPTDYYPVTVTDSTYGYRTYLGSPTYEVKNSGGTITSYTTTLANAISFVGSGGTVTAMKNNSSGAVTVNKNMTLNPNGKTITLSGAITNSGTLSVSGSGTITSSTVTSFVNSGTMTLATATVAYTGATSTETGGLPVIDNKGVFTISSGKISSTDLGIRTTGTSVTISGGTIDVDKRGMFVRSGTVTMTGGTVDGPWYGITMYKITSAVTMNISGGTITNAGANVDSAGIRVVGTSSYSATLNFSGSAKITNTLYGNGMQVSDYATANITAGTIVGTGCGISRVTDNSNLTVGTSGGTPSTSSPIIAGGSCSVYSTNAWYFYDGALYGTQSPTYSDASPTVPSGYYIATTSDSTYNTSGYKTYLSSDSTAPTIAYGTNGGAKYISGSASTATRSTTITATDTGGSGLAALYYYWSTSSTAPASSSTNWVAITNGETVSKSMSRSSAYYLHAKAVDKVGNETISSSKAFYANGWSGNYYYSSGSTLKSTVSNLYPSGGGSTKYYYHFNSSGVRSTGWVSYNDYWYYFNSSSNNGAAVCNTSHTISSNSVSFDSSCHLSTGWRSDGTYWYYYSSGTMKTGSTAASTVSALYVAFQGTTKWYSFATNGRYSYSYYPYTDGGVTGCSNMSYANGSSCLASRKFGSESKSVVYFTNGTVRNTSGNSSSKLVGFIIDDTASVTYTSMTTSSTNLGFINGQWNKCYYYIDGSITNDTEYTCE